MKFRFFDFEVFPEWWCCTFGDLPEGITNPLDLPESIKDTFVTIDSDSRNARDDLMQLMKESGWCVVGYNIKSYDLAIANGIYQGFGVDHIKMISDLIVKPGQYLTREYPRMESFAHKRLPGCTYLDTFDSSTGSLKDKEAILGLNVMESKVPFDKVNLTVEDKADVKVYNRQDVYASMFWYLNTVRPFVVTKEILGRKFNIPERNWYTDTNAGLVCKALNVKPIRPTDADRVDIKLPQRIEKYCYDNLPAEVLQHVLNSKAVYKVILFNNEVVLADGGIHSTYLLDKYKVRKTDTTVLYCESNDEYALINIDAESYYPSMMIEFKTLSRAIENPQDFDDVRQERFRIKHKKNKTKEDDDTQLADKLILNTTYGASGSEYVPLYDPYQRTRTCRYGQLFLLALACKVSKIPHAKIIQMNTDGILARVRRKDLDLVHQYMQEWSDVSGIGMEEDRVERIWQRDVNNYYMIKEGGKEKTKGAWLNHTTVRPGYIMVAPLTAYVCGEAVCEWLRCKADIVHHIVGCKDLIKFCITTTKGGTYQECVQKRVAANGWEWEETMYKSNRLVATTDKSYGKLYKVKIDESGRHYTQMPSTPDHCLPLNDDMRHYLFSAIKPKLDYGYYLNNCAERMEGTWIKFDGDKEVVTYEFDYFGRF